MRQVLGVALTVRTFPPKATFFEALFTYMVAELHMILQPIL